MSFIILISLFQGSQIMTLIAYFFMFNISLILIEALTDLVIIKKRRWKDTDTNFLIFIRNQLLEKTVVGSIGVIYLMPFYWLTSLFTPINLLAWVLAFFAANLTYYWMYRIAHEHRNLWALHRVHHSSKDYNLSISFRLSILKGFIEWFFLRPMIFIGFSSFSNDSRTYSSSAISNMDIYRTY
jgi:sterol desaturase/sphingolipid hydroxylase (fatty acid hydroxylase superfamily)